MKRFIEGQSRTQGTLLPEIIDEYVEESNPVRIVDVFVDELDLEQLGFTGVNPADTGRPAYHPAVLLKLYIYGYLNRIQSSRCLEREAKRNIELMWLLGRLTPDFKTIASFARIMAKAFAASAGSSSCHAGSWDCLPKPRSQSTAASSKQPTIGTGISPAPN